MPAPGPHATQAERDAYDAAFYGGSNPNLSASQNAANYAASQGFDTGIYGGSSYTQPQFVPIPTPAARDAAYYGGSNPSLNVTNNAAAYARSQGWDTSIYNTPPPPPSRVRSSARDSITSAIVGPSPVFPAVSEASSGYTYDPNLSGFDNAAAYAASQNFGGGNIYGDDGSSYASDTTLVSQAPTGDIDTGPITGGPVELPSELTNPNSTFNPTIEDNPFREFNPEVDINKGPTYITPQQLDDLLGTRQDPDSPTIDQTLPPPPIEDFTFPPLADLGDVGEGYYGYDPFYQPGIGNSGYGAPGRYGNRRANL